MCIECVTSPFLQSLNKVLTALINLSMVSSKLLYNIDEFYENVLYSIICSSKSMKIIILYMYRLWTNM